MNTHRSKFISHILFLCALLASLVGGALTVTPARAAGFTVTKTADTADGVCDADCSLREAITSANALAGADVITFAANYTITLTSGSQLPAVTTQITITGNGAGNTIIQANLNPNTATYRVFEVSADGNLTLEGLTVRNGRCSGLCVTRGGMGGGILNAGGALSVTNSTLSDNYALYNGGGLYNEGTLTVTNSTLAGNHATAFGTAYGGGIYNDGTLTVTNSTISGNAATDRGGGISNYGGTLTVTNSTISSNGASNYGGGISNYAGTLTVTNSTLSGNSATYGGGISNYGGTLIMTNSMISGNSATWGGGISNYYGIATIMSSTLSGNSASLGGGIYLYGGMLTMTNSALSSNSASDRGGGIFIDTGTGTLTMMNSTLSGNSANYGGGVYNYGTLNYANTLIANSTSGGDCLQFGAVGTNTDNLVEDGSCSASLSGDPNLGPLADNGGPTQTFALLAGSPAIDAGDDATCAAAPVSNTSQNGVTRPQGSHCDIGSYEVEVAVDIAPTVVSILRANANPTNAGSVQFHVSFSELVTGVDPADFSLATSGSVSGASITSVVAGTPPSDYFVTVNTGTGSGTIRLDVVDDDSIMDSANNPLGGAGTLNGDFSSGEAYTKVVLVSSSFASVGSNDGWILESTETSNKGGSMNAASTIFVLGDAAGDKQFKSILHFNTASLPDTAVVTSITLKIKKYGLVGTNPFTTHGPLLVDIRKPSFRTAVLALADFQASASQTAIASFGSTPVSNWYSALFNDGTNINKTGTTQFRLRFTMDDNDDMSADYVKFFSGNYGIASARPHLIVQYYLP